MNISPNDEKLEKYLDELADEYKKLLFSALISRSKTLDDLSVSELLRLDNEIKKPLFQDYYRLQRRRRLFFSYGLIYVLLGFLGYIFSEMITGDFLYSRERMIALVSVVVGLVGLVICVYSFVSPTLGIFSKTNTNGQRNYIALLEYEVVAKWRELEGLVSDIGLSESKKAPRSIIDFLLENHLIDKNEYGTLKEFLKMRNNVVHSTENRYSANEIKEMIDNVDKIIEKIKK